MSSRAFNRWFLVLIACLVSLLNAPTAGAPPSSSSALAARAFRDASLFTPPVVREVGELHGFDRERAWWRFSATYGGEVPVRGFIDLRTGRPSLVELSLPWFPSLANASRAERPAFPGALGDRAPQILESLARGFLAENQDLFGVAPAELVLATVQPTGLVETASGREPRLWHLVFDWAPHGVRVEGAHVMFRVNHGNLIQVATVGIGGPSLVPAVTADKAPVDRAEARGILEGYVGGFDPSDLFYQDGELQVLPAAAPGTSGVAYAGPVGAGMRYRAAWVFAFSRGRDGEVWEAAVDARNGEILYFRDGSLRAAVKGTANLIVLGSATVTFPYADYQRSPVAYADSTGLFTSPNPRESKLDGKTVSVVDDCGTIDVTAASGDLDFGAGAGICVVDNMAYKGNGDGNTLAARTAYYYVALGKKVAANHFPGNVWATSTKTIVHTHYNNTTCAPKIVKTTGELQFDLPASGTCNNSGEIPGIVLHETGHAVNRNDGTAVTDGGSDEAYGDIFSFLQTKDSCIGRGWGYSGCGHLEKYTCIACDGVREVHWVDQLGGTPHTPVTNLNCGLDTSKEPNPGPCGREPHCESAPATEAVWDLLGNLKESGLTTAQAWQTIEDLFLDSRPSAGAMFTCSNGLEGGINGGSLYNTLRAADDCDGNLANGTPHAAAIFASLDLHGIAVGTAGDAANQDDTTPLVADFSYSCTNANCTFDGSLSTPTAGISLYKWTFGDNSGGTTGATPTHLYSATGTYQVTLTVKDVCGRTSSKTKAVSVVSPYVVIGESARITLSAYNPQTITLTRSYTNPVVIAQPLMLSSVTIPSLPRIYNVTSNSFDISMSKQASQLGLTGETVHYLVLEAGTWQLEGGGAVLQVGKITTDATVARFLPNTWAQVTFPQAFSQTPMTLAQVQTLSLSTTTWIDVRQRNASATGFQVAMEPLESRTLPLATTETIGWVALEPAIGTWGTSPYAASRSSSVDSNWSTITYHSPCTLDWIHPIPLASLGTYNEGHGHLRFRNLNSPVACAWDLEVEEDTSYDLETTHVPEGVNSLVLQANAPLKATPLAP